MDRSDDNVKEIQALISLIDDPDVDVYNQIAKKIFIYGTNIIPYLETAWDKFPEPVVQKRIEELIHQIQFQNIKTELKLWKQENVKDLLYGWVIITKYKYPEFKEEDIKVKLNNIRKDIWLELNDDLTALEKIKVFNHVFYDSYGFKGNTVDYHNPDNSFINKVFETKKGNPVSLGLIYYLLAKSLDIPVKALNFPEHFVLAYISKILNPHLSLKETNEDNYESLFFINPFSKGNVFSRQEAEWFLTQLNIESNSKYFKSSTNNQLIERLLFGLITSYERSHDLDKAKEVKQLFDIIVKD